MTDEHQGQGVLSALALVRASGRVYHRRRHGADAALQLLHHNIVKASRAGASVPELSDASGLSRQAIYRRITDGDVQCPVD